MAPVLFLAYGTRRLEVLSSAGFDAVCHQAEAALALHPQSYDLYDACGKIDADSFDRSLASSRGLCVLELREKAEWQKMRQMETQIQRLMERDAAQLEAAVEAQVAAKVDEAMEKLKVELRADLEVQKTDTLADSSSLSSRVASLETELCELQIDSSGDLGRLEAALMTAQQEMEELRHFTAEQLRCLEATEDVQTKKAVEELESMKTKVAALELDLSEQAITNSATNGHLESGVATAKQELQSLRHYMAEQLSFVNSKMDEVKEVKDLKLEAAYAKLDEESKFAGTFGTTSAWSDGFKSHQLYGKMDKVLWKSAPTLKRPKSFQQLPPLMP